MTIKEWLEEHQNDEVHEEAINKLIRQTIELLHVGDHCWLVQPDGEVAPWVWTDSDLERTWNRNGLVNKCKEMAETTAVMLKVNS